MVGFANSLSPLVVKSGYCKLSLYLATSCLLSSLQIVIHQLAVLRTRCACFFFSPSLGFYSNIPRLFGLALAVKLIVFVYPLISMSPDSLISTSLSYCFVELPIQRDTYQVLALPMFLLNR